MKTQRWRINVELEWDASEVMVPNEQAVRYRFEQTLNKSVRVVGFAAAVVPPAGPKDHSR